MLQLVFESDLTYGNPNQSAMNLLPIIRTRSGLRFVTVLISCFVALAHISAFDETLVKQPREEGRNYIGNFPARNDADGKNSPLSRERRAIKKTVTITKNFEKRLKALEERFVTPFFSLSFQCSTTHTSQFKMATYSYRISSKRLPALAIFFSVITSKH